jgi:hypothetical protein
MSHLSSLPLGSQILAISFTSKGRQSSNQTEHNPHEPALRNVCPVYVVLASPTGHRTCALSSRRKVRRPLRYLQVSNGHDKEIESKYQLLHIRFAIATMELPTKLRNGGFVYLLFCRPDQFSRSSYVDDNSCLLVSSLPSLFYTVSSHRDIYIYECYGMITQCVLPPGPM